MQSAIEKIIGRGQRYIAIKKTAINPTNANVRTGAPAYNQASPAAQTGFGST